MHDTTCGRSLHPSGLYDSRCSTTLQVLLTPRSGDGRGDFFDAGQGMNPNLDVLLNHLDGVKQVGPNQWKAKCPAHDDRNPSLAIGVGDDDRILLKCWAGCGAADVVHAIGMQVSDLFVKDPQRLVATGRQRLAFNYKNTVQLLARDIWLLELIASDMEAGRQLTAEGRQALTRARKNIQNALKAANVGA